MNPAGVLLDIDPSIVKPGWIALLVVVFIGAALVLLFFSLRRQVRKISPELPYANEPDAGRPRARRVDPGQGDTKADGGADSAPPAPDITGKKP